METAETCHRCGSRIPPLWQQKGCPGCLLKAGMKVTDGSSEDSLLTTYPEMSGASLPRSDTGTEDLQALPQPGELWGRFQILERLGEGAMGVVFAALDVGLERRVALKLMKRPEVRDHEVRRQLHERFILEGRNTAALEHPHVVTLFGAGEVRGWSYLEMQLLSGESLERVVARSALPVAQAGAYVLQCARALAFAHGRQPPIIHCDIKPSNLFLTSDGTVKVLDYGISRVLAEGSGKASGRIAGTPHYMSPEQWMRREADARSDQYALGVTFFHLLTARLPFQGSLPEIMAAHLSVDLPGPEDLEVSIPPAVTAVLRRMTAKRPIDRYQSSDELVGALEQALGPEVERRLQSGGRPSSDQSPYRGLEVFEAEHARWFFGRHALIERLESRFVSLLESSRDRPDAVRILPVLGPSGSGKSSAVRAGLIPRLSRTDIFASLAPFAWGDDLQAPAAAPAWYPVIITPGTHPIDALAVALARLSEDHTAPAENARDLSERLMRPDARGEYCGLRLALDALEHVVPQPILLVIDQIEEIFSLCDDEKERAAFVEGLFAATRGTEGRVAAIVTIRSDFLGQTQSYPGLNRLLAEEGVIVGAMGPNELREAIARPAELQGWPLDSGIITLLVEQATGRPGALPLLQFALQAIWEGMVQGYPPAETMSRLGGLGGALAGEAQRLFDALPTADQARARRAFLGMAQFGDDGQVSRRQARVSDLLVRGDALAELRRVLHALATPGRRLVSLSVDSDGKEVVDVCHEALFHHWDSLRRWLKEGEVDLRFLRKLELAAREWDHAGRPEGLLWRDPLLKQLRTFRKRAEHELSVLLVEFAARCIQRDRWSAFRMRLIGAAAIGVVALSAFAVVDRAGALKRGTFYRSQQIAFQKLHDGATDQVLSEPVVLFRGLAESWPIVDAWLGYPEQRWDTGFNRDEFQSSVQDELLTGLQQPDGSDAPQWLIGHMKPARRALRYITMGESDLGQASALAAVKGQGERLERVSLFPLLAVSGMVGVPVVDAAFDVTRELSTYQIAGSGDMVPAPSPSAFVGSLCLLADIEICRERTEAWVRESEQAIDGTTDRLTSVLGLLNASGSRKNGPHQSLRALSEAPGQADAELTLATQAADCSRLAEVRQTLRGEVQAILSLDVVLDYLRVCGQAEDVRMLVSLGPRLISIGLAPHDPRVLQNLARAAIALGGERAVGELEPLLKLRVPAVDTAHIVYALLDLPPDATMPLLRTLVNDPRPAVGAASAWLLAQYGDPTGLSRLIASIEETPYQYTSGLYLESLGLYRGDALKERLLNLWRAHGTERFVKRGISDALRWYLDDPRVQRVFEELLEERDVWMNSRTIRALLSAFGSTPRPVLARWNDSQSIKLRTAALIARQALDDQPYLEAAQRFMVNAGDWAEYEMSLEALRSAFLLSSPEAVVHAATDPRSSVRLAARLAVGSYAEPDRLAAAIRDAFSRISDPWQRQGLEHLRWTLEAAGRVARLRAGLERDIQSPAFLHGHQMLDRIQGGGSTDYSLDWAVSFGAGLPPAMMRWTPTWLMRLNTVALHQIQLFEWGSPSYRQWILSVPREKREKEFNDPLLQFHLRLYACRVWAGLEAPRSVSGI